MNKDKEFPMLRRLFLVLQSIFLHEMKIRREKNKRELKKKIRKEKKKE